MAEKRPKGSPERIGRLLAGNSKNKVLGTRLKDLEIWQIWDKAVGEAIARRTKPLRFIGGQLTVVVSGGSWMQQLSFMKIELMQRINAQLGDERIKEIILKAGKFEAENESQAELKYRKPKPVSKEQEEWINRQLVDVNDDELRCSLKILMERHYQSS